MASNAKSLSVAALLVAGMATGAMSDAPQTSGRVQASTGGAGLPPGVTTEAELATWLAGEIEDAAVAAATQTAQSFDRDQARAQERAALLTGTNPEAVEFQAMTPADQEAALDTLVAEALQAAIADAVADAIAQAITEAGVSPAVAAAAMNLVQASLTDTVIAALQSVAPDVATALESGDLGSLETVIAEAVAEVNTVVQQVAAANPPGSPQTRSTGTDPSISPPTTVVVIYRG